jgi:hypothetical protein
MSCQAVQVCANGACAVYSDAAYPGLVVGTVERVLSPQETASLFVEARRRGAWRDLPAAPQDFAALVRGVELNTRDRASAEAPALRLTVFLTEDEYQEVSLDPGLLVRYSPHGADHERPPQSRPALLPYWNVTGCILPLCGKKDPRCEVLFLTGVYERRSGRAIDWSSGQAVPGPALIEPQTFLRPHPAPS